MRNMKLRLWIKRNSREKLLLIMGMVNFGTFLSSVSLSQACMYVQEVRYEFDGTFGADATIDKYAGDIFGPLENQAFSGEIDVYGGYFYFETYGYAYAAADMYEFLHWDTRSLIFMNDGNYFDVRDTEGEPTALTIKRGTAKIGGNVVASAVPVPGALWLLGSGLIGFAAIRKMLPPAPNKRL